jgi:hypothetical protein
LIDHGDETTIFVTEWNSFNDEIAIVTEWNSFNDESYSSPMYPGFRHNMLRRQAAKRRLPRWQLTCPATWPLTCPATWPLTCRATRQLTCPALWSLMCRATRRLTCIVDDVSCHVSADLAVTWVSRCRFVCAMWRTCTLTFSSQMWLQICHQNNYRIITCAHADFNTK